jgi:multidrug resistance efflux pump
MYRARAASAAASEVGAVPTARVARGALDVTVRARGELRASKQQAILAPPVGSSLRILTLVEPGTPVKAGDVIVSFDPADQRYALEQAESELLEAEQNILKRRADIGAQEAQDQVALLTARFNVRRAELDARIDRDLIAANEFEIRRVSLDEARRTLVQTEEDVKARATVSSAGLSVLEEARVKAQMSADRARQNMEMLEIRSPIDGIASVRENVDASGGIFFTGMTLPAYRVGDTANPGRPIADVFDVSGMEIRATVNEQERANLTVGLPASVTSNSVPGITLAAKVQAISGLGRAEIESGPLRRFDMTIMLDAPDARLLPGTSVDLALDGARLEDVLTLPRQAVVEENGRPTVFIRSGARFEPREVKVVNRSEARVAIEGLDEGTEVALIRPTAARASGETEAASTGPAVVR